MAVRYGVINGLADNRIGSIVPVGATCFREKIIEKHFFLERSIGCSDISFSMTRQEFTDIVKSDRELEKAFGAADFYLNEKQ